MADKYIEIMTEEAISQEQLSGSLKLILLANDVTYKRCVNAMNILIKPE